MPNYPVNYYHYPLHLQLNFFNCLKLLNITGTNMYVYGKHQTNKRNKCRIAGKGEEKKRY